MHAARQMGFADRSQCPTLVKLAAEYIRKADGCEDEIYTFFAGEPECDSLFIKLVEEFERCILSYFAFHWSQAPTMISQVTILPEEVFHLWLSLHMFVWTLGNFCATASSFYATISRALSQSNFSGSEH